MILKSGDRVKFVNEKGEGKVTKILNSSRVLVSIEDGFEIPYLSSDLIKIEENATSRVNIYNTVDERSSQPSQRELPIDNEDDLEQITLKPSRLLDYESKGVYLAFVPQNQRLPEAGNTEVFLINHSDTKLLYTIYLKDNRGKYYAKSYGIVDEESKLTVETIEDNELDSWAHGFMQLIYFNYKDNRIMSPVNEEFVIKTYKSFKAENYKSSVFFEDEKAVVININEYFNQTSNIEKEFDKDEEEASAKEREMLAEAMNTKQKTIANNREDFIKKYIQEEGFAEVDMHIWELVEDYSKLSPNDIFNLQMIYFNKCLDSALANHLRKVVFIHGVGNGTLKKEIRSKLTTEYPEITIYDAPIAKYGVGATEIVIPQNFRI